MVKSNIDSAVKVDYTLVFTPVGSIYRRVTSSDITSMGNMVKSEEKTL